MVNEAVSEVSMVPSCSWDEIDSASTDAVGDGASTAAPVAPPSVYNKIAVSTGVLVSVGTEISLVYTSAAFGQEGMFMGWPNELQMETAKSMVAIAVNVSYQGVFGFFRM